MGSLERIIAWIALLIGLLAAAPAAASPLAPSCHAFSTPETSYAQLAANAPEWICRSTHWKDSRPIGWIRFDAQSWQGGAAPKTFITRITKFDRLTLMAIRADGSALTISRTPDEVTPRAGGAIFSTPLPPIPDDTVAIVARIERPWNGAILSDAWLSSDADAGAWPMAVLVAFGMLLGLLFAPVIFDITLYSVLRQRFVLWHCTLVLAMLSYVATFSGMTSIFIRLDIVTVAALNGLAPALAVAFAGFFVADFLEPGTLSRTMRRALWTSSAIALLGPAIITLHPPFLDYRSHQFYFIGFIPALLVHIAAMVQAWRRRSRSVKFLTAAWAPILLCMAERILRGLGLYGAPHWTDELLYFALIAEVLISALGVADRMMSLRDQRDNARIQARILGNLAEQDPLTGLLNRRAIEPRFADLCDAGFCTFALIDLDHFKSINDRHGHAVGDEVLRAVASGLAPDENTLAMRLGGEEFLLLLRGEDGGLRAEQRREALARHIASIVPGIGPTVTASMGVIEGPAETMATSSFRDIYARADKLLYEAKQAGRNRMIGEKLTLFAAPKADRRRGDRRKSPRRRSA